MTLNEYQQQAMTTCMETSKNIPYMLFNLQGEVGELSSKIAKAIRKDQVSLDSYGKFSILRTEWVSLNEALMGELGDILWQLAGVCSVLGYPLENIAEQNLEKLASRKKRGVIDGSGDNR